MDSYFHVAVYMIYYLSVNLLSIDYFVFTEEREKKVDFSTFLKFVFCRQNYSPGEFQNSW